MCCSSKIINVITTFHLGMTKDDVECLKIEYTKRSYKFPRRCPRKMRIFMCFSNHLLHIKQTRHQRLLRSKDQEHNKAMNKEHIHNTSTTGVSLGPSISSTQLEGNMPKRPSGPRPLHQPSSNGSTSVIISPGSKVISSSFSEINSN